MTVFARTLALGGRLAEGDLDMRQRWAYGLLALLVSSVLVQGAVAPGTAAVLSSLRPLLSTLLFGQDRFAVLPRESSRTAGADATVERQPVASGADAGGEAGAAAGDVAAMLVVAIALVFSLPLRSGQLRHACRQGQTPEGLHREAGRCPTGPPAWA